jgi:hypothetical protein
MRFLYSSHRNIAAHFGDYPRARIEDLRQTLFAESLCRTFLAGLQPREVGMAR